MKLNLLFFSLIAVVVSSCTQPINTHIINDVAGSYELVEYSSTTSTDDSPTGALSVLAVDDEHITITAKGTSGKIKINYTYANVTLVQLERNFYVLHYKGKQIGVAGDDGVSRYVNLYPSSSITIKAIEF